MLLSLSHTNKRWLFSIIMILSILVLIYYNKINYHIEEYKTIAEAEDDLRSITDEINVMNKQIEDLNTTNTTEIDDLITNSKYMASSISTYNSYDIQEGFFGKFTLNKQVQESLIILDDIKKQNKNNIAKLNPIRDQIQVLNTQLTGKSNE
jgi:hypothetical protein